MRGEPVGASLSPHEGSYGGLWWGVEEWVAENESRVDICGVWSGQETN